MFTIKVILDRDDLINSTEYLQTNNIQNIDKIINDLKSLNFHIQSENFTANILQYINKINIHMMNIYSENFESVINYNSILNFFIFDGIMKNSKIYGNLYSGTLNPLIRYLGQLENKNFDENIKFASHIIYYFNGYDKLSMLINIVKTKNFCIQEHIYINRPASSLLLKSLLKFKPNVNAELLHKTAIGIFRCDYLISSPIDIMIGIFQKLVGENILEKISIFDDPDMAEKEEILDQIFSEDYFAYEYSLSSKYFFKIIE